MEPPTNVSNFDLNPSSPSFASSSDFLQSNSMQQTNVSQKIQVFPQTQVCEKQVCLKQVGQASQVCQNQNVLQSQLSSQQVSSHQVSSLQLSSQQQCSNESIVECLEDDDVFCDSSTCCIEPEQRARSHTWPVRQQHISSVLINQQKHLFNNCIPNIPSTSSLAEEENVSCSSKHSSFLSLLKQSELNSNNNLSCSSISEFSLQQKKIKPKRIRRKTNENEKNFHQLPNDYGRKPNPWGNESYSDLIARALITAPEGKLKLNEIYQWFSENVPYFAGRSSQEEAQGWKVPLFNYIILKINSEKI